MANVDPLITFLAMGALVAALYIEARRRRSLDKSLWIGAACLAGIFVVRWLLTTPIFVHANLHGPLLLNAPYHAPATVFRNYGSFGILVQGLIMRLFGANLTVVAASNQLFAVLTVGLMAHVARRWTGSRLAGACVVAAAALNPVLMRQGSSEDAHNLAVLLAWLALAAGEHFASEGRRASLVVCTAAAVLMIETRQIMFAFIPLFPLWILVRGQKAQRRELAVASGVMFLALVFRVAISCTDPGQAAHMGSVLSRLASWDALALAVTQHPMIAPSLAAYLWPLYAVAAVWLVRHSWTSRLLLGSLVALTLSSLWLYEGQNVALMFRMPVLTVAVFCAGLGGWRITAALRSPWPSLTGGVFAAALGIAPIFLPGWALLNAISPLTREYQYVRDVIPSLPRRITLVPGIDNLHYPTPAYELPVHLFEDAGIALDQAGSGAPRVFLRGVICRAYSLQEILPGIEIGYNMHSVDPALLERILEAFATTGPSSFDVPSQERPECQRLMRGATPIGEPRMIEPVPQDAPFELYGPEPIVLQLYLLPADADGRL
jgi:hypothetical protein